MPLARYGRERGVEARFIEFMPLDADGNWQRDKVLFAADIRDKLSQEIAPLVAVPDQDLRAPASEFMFSDGIGERRIHRLSEPAVL